MTLTYKYGKVPMYILLKPDPAMYVEDGTKLSYMSIHVYV